MDELRAKLAAAEADSARFYEAFHREMQRADAAEAERERCSKELVWRIEAETLAAKERDAARAEADRLADLLRQERTLRQTARAELAEAKHARDDFARDAAVTGQRNAELAAELQRLELKTFGCRYPHQYPTALEDMAAELAEARAEVERLQGFINANTRKGPNGETLCRGCEYKMRQVERLHSCLAYETEAHVAERTRLRAALVQAQTTMLRMNREGGHGLDVHDRLRADLAVIAAALAAAPGNEGGDE